MVETTNVVYNDSTFHDGYCIIDKSIVYHSVTDIDFSINLISDMEVYYLLFNRVRKII